MQGAFTGDLSLSTSNQCILPVAYISAGPPTLSNASSASFVFSATQGAPLAFNDAHRVQLKPPAQSVMTLIRRMSQAASLP